MGNRKQRGHGEGSIYQRDDGRWCGSVNVGYVNGKRKRKYFYGKTRAEVRDKLNRALYEQQRGIDILRDERMTVGAFLDSWLTDVKPNLAPKTYRSYSDTVRLHLRQEIGKVKLMKLRPDQVSGLLRSKLKDGLSATSVNYIRTVLRIALGRAVAWGHIERNVAALVDPVKRKRVIEAKPFTPDEARAFLDAARGHRLEALFTVALALGLRQGEALGLRWEDVELDTGLLHVTYALQRIDGTLQLKEPKTEQSRRKVVLPSVCTDALRRHRVRQIEDQLAAGSDWQGNDLGLVFTSVRGTPLDPGNVYKRFRKLLRDAGIDDRRFHDLRHSAASLLAAQGVEARTVMGVLGHTQIATTLDLYSHLFEEAKRDAADRMDQALGVVAAQ